MPRALPLGAGLYREACSERCGYNVRYRGLQPNSLSTPTPRASVILLSARDVAPPVTDDLIHVNGPGRDDAVTEGRVSKFVAQVEQLSFSARHVREAGQEIFCVTDRWAAFRSGTDVLREANARRGAVINAADWSWAFRKAAATGDGGALHDLRGEVYDGTSTAVRARPCMTARSRGQQRGRTQRRRSPAPRTGVSQPRGPRSR